MTAGIFPLDVVQAAQSSEKTWHIPASVSLAQWALESAWGSALSAPNNCFGIKAAAGQLGVACATHEDNGTHLVAAKARFRIFASLSEAFDEHAKLLATAKPYAKARAVLPDADAFADALTGVYATDHLYGAKLRSIMRAHDLHRWDAAGRIVTGFQPRPVAPRASTVAPVIDAKPATPRVVFVPPITIPAPQPSLWARIVSSFRKAA